MAAFRKRIVDRARRVTKSDAIADELDLEIGNRLHRWAELANTSDLVYSHRGQDKKETKAILIRPMEIEQARGEWQASGSLREVEGEVDVVLREYRSERG